ncbi:MAG: PilZ domain-containing protein [Nitrospirae bacterium]|nr:PilZ domain-containing protein [Nitrospirota bacterium]MBI3378588.1 PilZ domain-containing protein [Nitrospirota bacterium]
MSKRQLTRHRKRLETKFEVDSMAADSVVYTGITSDISERGIFIRTRYGLVPGTVIKIELYLPDNKISKLKGKVKRSIRTPIVSLKNGMGIEIIEKDSSYTIFLNAMDEGNKDNPSAPQENSSASPPPEYLIITCSDCNVKNKVAREKLSLNPRCGKCGTFLRAEDTL